MSTILDALRKAQDETGEGRGSRPLPLPEDGPPRPPRRGRSRGLPGWLVTAGVILLVAVVGVFAFGRRLGILSGGEAVTTGAAQTAQSDAGDAASPQTEPSSVAAGLPRHIAPVGEEPGTPPTGRRLANAERARPPAPAERDVGAPAAAGGTLEVVRAKKQSRVKKVEERAEHLRRMRDRLAQARLKAAERQGQPVRPPIPIAVPPTNGQAPPPGAGRPEPVAPAPPRVAAASGAPPVAAAPREAVPTDAGAGAAAAPRPDPEARPGAALGAATLGGRGDVAPGPAGASAPPAAPPREAPAAAVPAAPPAPAPPPAAPVAVARAPEPAPVPEPARVGAAGVEDEVEPQPVALASRAAAIPPPPRPEPPILRRAPGDAPQVAINILQWSSEPTRRFAFVSVDGGGMTQVREGDRIGALTVKRIHEQMIEFGFNDSSFLLRAN